MPIVATGGIGLSLRPAFMTDKRVADPLHDHCGISGLGITIQPDLLAANL